jgi:hypothetical protein
VNKPHDAAAHQSPEGYAQESNDIGLAKPVWPDESLARHQQDSQQSGIMKPRCSQKEKENAEEHGA